LAIPSFVRGRALTLSGILALCVLAWAYLLVEASGMSGMSEMSEMAGMADMAGDAMGSRWTLTEWAYLCVMWSIMMVAMMLPSALPAILLVERVAASCRERNASRAAVSATTPLFVAGYLASWTAYSVVAATVQWALHGALLVSDAMASASPVLSGSLLVGAGLFQLTPLKIRCVTHCRSPLSFLMGHWREGAWGAFRMGVGHGSYCVACCWALMALLFVLGVMNLIWVTALAAIVLLEKTLPAGRWVTGSLGAGLIAWGVVVLLQNA
jgi:predicted metal-binding membrane protein